MTDEKFVPTYGFAGYRVGDHGTVLSDHWRNYPGRRMRQPFTAAYSYRTVYLYIGKKGYGIYVHRLVLLSFVGPPADPQMEAAHLNGNKDDNRLVNLRWVTRLENAAHKEFHGTVVWGERCGRAKLTAEQVVEIRRRLKSQSNREIATEFGVSQGAISLIKRRDQRARSCFASICCRV